MRLKQSRRISTILVLVLTLLGFLPQLAHAAQYVGYASANVGTNTCAGGFCASCTDPGTNAQQCGTGLSIQAPFAGQLTSVGYFTGNTLATSILIATFPAGTPATTNENCNTNGAATCQSTNGAQTYTLQDQESLSGLSPQAFFTINLAKAVTVAAAQWVAVEFISNNCSGTLGSACTINMLCGSGCGSSGASNGLVQSTCIKFGSSTPTVGNTFQTATPANCAIDTVIGATFTQAGQTGQSVTVTQCYGNCGSPAITLANTNSTHSVNFNQSITLFYEFQSNINGFILNVTTSLAKSYSNGQGIVEAIYTVPSCPLGQSPFTAQCPGFLASGWNVVGNPNKGKLSNGNYQIPISNGQWAAVSISGVFSPLDLNDTNTAVPVFQTQGGGCACPPPASITQATSFNAAFKMGLWAWIVGNVVTAQPPTTPGLGACPGLDCILTLATNSFCGVVTTACQTGSALFWVIILTIISISALVFFFNQTMPGVNIGRLGIGEMGILFFLGWIVIFTSFNLLSIYVLLLVFFVVAALSAKTVRGYAGI